MGTYTSTQFSDPVLKRRSISGRPAVQIARSGNFFWGFFMKFSFDALTACFSRTRNPVSLNLPAPFLCIIALSLLVRFRSRGSGCRDLGTITDSETTQPIEGIEVCDTQPGVGQVGSCVFSDASGNYVIDDIPGTPEVVVFTVESDVYASQTWPDVSTGEIGNSAVIDLSLAIAVTLTLRWIAVFRFLAA